MSDTSEFFFLAHQSNVQDKKKHTTKPEKGKRGIKVTPGTGHHVTLIEKAMYDKKAQPRSVMTSRLRKIEWQCGRSQHLKTNG